MSPNLKIKPKARTVFVAESTLFAEGRLLAKAYKIPFNTLLVLLLENAVNEWSVPTMEALPRPDNEELAREVEKDLT